MQIAKRIFLFLAVNLLVMLMLSIVFGILSAFFPALRGGGGATMVLLAGLLGFGGAIISLLMSKMIAKWTHTMKILDRGTAVGDERWLLQTVDRLAAQAGITEMPEVAIYQSPEINAFCTGPSKNSSLVAVSTGLLARMSRDEIEGVLAHELSHAANGDMVTMTLVTGVVNTFVILLTWIITAAVMNALRGDRDREERGGFMDFILSQAIMTAVQLAIGMLASLLILMPFSRWREYRADAGGASLAGKAKMIGALEALADNFRLPQPAQAQAADPSFAAMKIGSLKRGDFFSTHPSLEDRIARLRAM